MFNIVFYENQIPEDRFPKLRGDYKLNTLQKGAKMFMGNKDITAVQDGLFSLIDGTEMFANCTELKQFAHLYGLKSLRTGYKMFYNCTALDDFRAQLGFLEDGSSMFGYCKSLQSFIIQLPYIKKGDSMFCGCTNLKAFQSNTLSLEDGWSMFASCTNLEHIVITLPALVNGQVMFYNCPKITEFKTPLPSLAEGSYMFSDCTNLKTFCVDLPKMSHGNGMFQGCSSLKTFDANLGSLISGNRMFSGCELLESFTSDLNSLEDGSYMFDDCTSLISFIGDLGSLTNGYYMFYSCKLDTKSIMFIADSINDISEITNLSVNNKKLHIGIGNEEPTDEEKEFLTEIHNKGWDVFVNGNTSSDKFSPTALTPIDGEETVTPKPYWAKPIEVEEEQAEYVSEDGKFYIVVGGQFIFVDDPETYGMFISHQDAVANMRLTPYVKQTTETV